MLMRARFFATAVARFVARARAREFYNGLGCGRASQREGKLDFYTGRELLLVRMCFFILFFHAERSGSGSDIASGCSEGVALIKKSCPRAECRERLEKDWGDEWEAVMR